MRSLNLTRCLTTALLLAPFVILSLADLLGI